MNIAILYAFIHREYFEMVYRRTLIIRSISIVYLLLLERIWIIISEEKPYGVK